MNSYDSKLSAYEQIYTEMSSSNLGSPLQSSPEAALGLHKDSIKELSFKQVLRFRSKCFWAISLLILKKS